MTLTPFLPEREDLWLSGRAFRTLPTASGWNMAACISSLDDGTVRAIMDRDSEGNDHAARYFECGRQHAADVARSVLYCRGLLDELVFPPLVTRPRTYCTNPDHQPGEHDASCTPPADPASPELRLLRAIFGLCGLCDRTDPHEHDENEE